MFHACNQVNVFASNCTRKRFQYERIRQFMPRISPVPLQRPRKVIKRSFGLCLSQGQRQAHGNQVRQTQTSLLEKNFVCTIKLRHNQRCMINAPLAA